jgi:molybdenum cofactor cytidylyltransferase
MNIEAVILAAGFSSRAGTFKMALDFGGKTMLQRNIEAMSPFCSRIVVVGGYQVERIEALIESYPQVELIFNSEYEEGMFSSVKKGVAEIRASKFLFTPGDYPLITSDLCEILLEAEGEVVVPTFKGRKGHPIVLKKDLIPGILAESKTSNLKVFLQSRKIHLVEVEDNSILLDVDTIEDYKKANALYFSKAKNDLL